MASSLKLVGCSWYTFLATNPATFDIIHIIEGCRDGSYNSESRGVSMG